MTRHPPKLRANRRAGPCETCGQLVASGEGIVTLIKGTWWLTHQPPTWVGSPSSGQMEGGCPSSRVSAKTADIPAERTLPMQRDPEIPRLVGITQAADVLGKSRQWVWQLIEDGDLPANKDTGTIVLREQVVLEYKARMDLERQTR